MLTMADSIYPANLPGGYDAYLGYVDGRWPTAAALRARFPGKPILTLTVLGGDHVADGCDREPGDLSAESAVAWAKGRIIAGQLRPVIYASASNMKAVADALPSAGLSRAAVRLLSAHYGAGKHICGPDTCKLVPFACDGTQWADDAPGEAGTRIDASILDQDFFTGPRPAGWMEDMMRLLPALHLGARGRDVYTIQGLCVARGHNLGTTGKRHDGVDGDFGAMTEAAVKAEQKSAGIKDDGRVGPATWPVLLGV